MAAAVSFLALLVLFWPLACIVQLRAAKSQIFTSARDRLRLDRDERATARLQRRRQREQERRQLEQTDVRQARLGQMTGMGAPEQHAGRQARLDAKSVWLTECKVENVRLSQWNTPASLLRFHQHVMHDSTTLSLLQPVCSPYSTPPLPDELLPTKLDDISGQSTLSYNSAAPLHGHTTG